MTEALATSEPSRGEGDPYVIDGFDTRAPRPGLSRRATARARAIAEGLFSTEDGPPPADRLDWMERDLADFFGHVGLRGRVIFLVTTGALYYLAPLLIGRLSTLRGLDWADRVRAIEALDRTPLNLALLAAKAMLCIVYFEHPDAAAEIGWDQECMKP